MFLFGRKLLIKSVLYSMLHSYSLMANPSILETFENYSISPYCRVRTFPFSLCYVILVKK